MFVLRLSSDFHTAADGTVSINGRDFELKSRDQAVALITYRNVVSLPAVRFDRFDNRDAAEEYIKRTEPTCPRVSLDGKQPTPPLTWDEHLMWLHTHGLKSVLEGDNPVPDWIK